jgi:hypothetical protein
MERQLCAMLNGRAEAADAAEDQKQGMKATSVEALVCHE